MSIGLVGKKIGMTRVFTPEGASIPVTVLQIEPNYVTQVKSKQTDGYCAVQVTTGSIAERKLSSPKKGTFEKADVRPGRGLWEFRIDENEVDRYQVGDSFRASLFEKDQIVDVHGTSIGKGFTGVMKRYGFGGGRATHGNSKAHRKPGSIGQNQTPGRVFPGKKMAGHSGNQKTVQQNLKVVKVDVARSLLLIKGSIPGSRQSDIIVKSAVKKKNRKK